MNEARVVVAVIVIVAQFGLAAVVTTVTARAGSGALARNQWTGIRTPSTMRSDSAWVAGHRAARRFSPLFFVNAALFGALSWAGVLQRWPVAALTALGIGSFVVVIVLAVVIAVVASRAARAADDGSPR